jgi:pimeloyl-ACP methyl ester carboxylesterase
MPTWNSETLEHGLRALRGGMGSTVVLLPGWPETAEAYSEVFPLLAEHHRVLAIDPPGLGESAPSARGYDTAAISRMLEEAVGNTVDAPIHLVGHDVGAWIAYAWAAQFPERLRSLTLLDSSIPGLAKPQNFPLPYETNLKLWQFSFNALPELPEVLTQGREREVLDWLFNRKSEHPERISPARRNRYVECYSRPSGMSQGFAYYRAVAQSAQQNLAFSQNKLPMPVLTLGGKSATGDNLRRSMEPFAVHVEGGVIEDCGHYVMEEQPEQVAGRLLAFFKVAEKAKP